MSSNPSTTTTVICVRLPNEVFAILKRRADKQGLLVSEYLKRRIQYDTLRSHGKK